MIFDEVINRYAGNIGLLIAEVEGKFPEKYREQSTKLMDDMIRENKSQEEIDNAVEILYPELKRLIYEELDNADKCIEKIKSDYSL